MIRGLLGPLAGQGDLTGAALEAAYRITAPSLRANFVTTLDGVVALDGVSGALGGPADKEVFATLRALSDVVLIGAGTLRTEDYGPAWLAAGRRDRRARRGQQPLPTVAVVTTTGDLDPSSRLFTERREGQPPPPRPIVFASGPVADRTAAALSTVATVRPIGPGTAGLASMVATLAGIGAGRILCEGGAGLLGQLAGAGLVDDLCLTWSPLLGGPGSPTLAGDPHAASWVAPVPLDLVGLLEADGVLLARYAGRRDRSTPQHPGAG